MTKTRMNKGVQENPTASDSSAQSGRIRDYESDALTARIKDVIGDRKVVWFAAECGIGESTLRNILQGALPRTDILVAIALAGDVTVEWLATGKGPKTRAEARALEAAAEPAPGEAELLDTYRTAGPSGRAALETVAAAIRHQTLAAWFHAGQAITEAANLFDKSKK